MLNRFHMNHGGKDRFDANYLFLPALNIVAFPFICASLCFPCDWKANRSCYCTYYNKIVYNHPNRLLDGCKVYYNVYIPHLSSFDLSSFDPSLDPSLNQRMCQYELLHTVSVSVESFVSFHWLIHTHQQLIGCQWECCYGVFVYGIPRNVLVIQWKLALFYIVTIVCCTWKWRPCKFWTRTLDLFNSGSRDFPNET